MDYKLVLTTFTVVFLAELGDKTQLAVLAFTGSSESKISVFFGASLALVLSTLAAVLLGELICRYIPIKATHIGAGVLFIAIGGVILYSELSK